MLALGDEATGTTVLSDLHARLGQKGEAADLDALWKKLGLEKKAGRLVLNDNALRRSITKPRG
jgi:hypothetical protein